MDTVKVRKDLSKPGLLQVVRSGFDQVVDPVEGRKFVTSECLMAGLAVFLEKHASLLPYERSMREGSQGSNLLRLYGLKQVLCDTTMRRRLDRISPVQLRKAFQQVLQCAQRGKVLSRMMSWRGHYLVAVDGTGTFSSRQVHGPCCLQMQHRDGSTSYVHQQLCAVMVHPDRRQVLPMAVEAIGNGDGSAKNDCERNAWARLVPKLASLYPRMKQVVLADGLFSHGPPIRLLQQHGLRFLLAARSGDHPHLQKQLDGSQVPWFADPSPEGQERDRRLRVVRHLERNAANPDLKIQVLQCSERRTQDRDGRREFTWVTDLSVNPPTPATWLEQLAAAGKLRTRPSTPEGCPESGTQLRTRQQASVGPVRRIDVAGVLDRPSAGTRLPGHEAALGQVPLPNRGLGAAARQFLRSDVPQLAGTVRPRPGGLCRPDSFRHLLTADVFPAQ